ncbi:hypothetical protein HG535_0A07210 [Zygotorulaspora mrakii]|uniref:Uncharacterized protein n=1 Tax=Zygotorulaspora mrakii TaxID=42260 RepID=A0A7H9AYC5_ZYGMR|nr:uncharacterized protein HG535_0A07210 [Zygotorulaspora mrakii]QLG70779.1 hypothetical protein HG535_0A07210 [Zygotorulaspora mrakii]
MATFLRPLLVAMEKVNNLNGKYLKLTFEEQKELGIVGRFKVYNWTFEMICLGILGLIFAFYKVGMLINENRAKRMFSSISDFCKDELKFARVGFNSKDGSKLLYIEERGKTWFSTFATGRSAVESLSVKTHMLSRSNPIAMITEYLLNFFFPSLAVQDIGEYCEVVIKPSGVFVSTETAKVNENSGEVLNNFKFITSVVNKAAMNELRRENYYLSLTRTSESAKLPIEYVYMSELNQLNEFFHHYASPNFNETLKNASQLVKFIGFTDLPTTKPLTDKLWVANQQPRVVIRTSIPASQQDLKIFNEVLYSVVELIDNFTRDLQQKSPSVFITHDILKKSNQLRVQELAKIIKAAKQVEREMAQEKKQEAEKEKRRQMKASGEQEKYDQRMKEKRERRQKNRQKTRM